MSTRTPTKKRTRNPGDAAAGWAFVSPWIVGFIFFSGLPIIASFILSLTKWNLMGIPEFVGFDNYRGLLSGDSVLLKTLAITLIFTIINVTVIIFTSLMLALLLNMNVKFKGV